MNFVKKIENVNDNESQEITLDDGSVIVITDEYITISNDDNCLEEITIERKSISRDSYNRVA